MQEFKIGVITLLMPPRYIFLPEPLLSERKEKTRLSKATINTSLSTILENVDLQSKKKVFSRITGKMVLKKHWKSAPEKRVNYSKNLLKTILFSELHLPVSLPCVKRNSHKSKNLDSIFFCS